MQFTARRFDTGRLARITIADGKVQSCASVAEPATLPAGVPWVGPGLVDIQVNGYGGQEFSSDQLTLPAIEKIVCTHHALGVTAFCPTLTTQSEKVFTASVAMIAAAAQQPGWGASIAGIHLEGPFISPEDGPRGAHPKEHCRPPCWDMFCRFQDAAQGKVVLTTLSPEYDQAPAFIEKAVASGVLVAIGHTGATGEQIKRAVDAGARLSTHLGNGAHRQLPRHPNYLWDQLAEDRLTASLIVDGHHLPPEVVKTFVRAKTPGRCIIVSDESGLAGMPEGRYTSSGCELEIHADGKLTIAGQKQLLAGASRPIGAGVINLMRWAELSLAQAWEMASSMPAALIGHKPGELRPGAPADLTLFRLPSGHGFEPAAELEVTATVLAGKVVFGSLPSGI